ncbi:phosphoribosylaminoimidazole-succinocarboxamide synthase, chloroplastic-like [Gossypium australe]|uniref:Phosphoribosylaminoimidazole-succinocarboxamide synthase, chloroplastic-like n=1 Tax=Gossypium australe TaxID=47621 RepID=A0A5B6V9G5_9ROSI|nr:phosphoribosylaminoimidazole-succinocarboxamide synthase, chloroplastic-like [Gossypium australe]
MVGHETRYFRICIEVFDLSASESRASGAFGFALTCDDTKVEMRQSYMYFVSGLTLTLKKKDVVWVVVDRLTKSAHFILNKLEEALGTNLNFSTAFHPQTNGQFERVIQVLEDTLRCCVLKFEGNWEKYLPLIDDKVFLKVSQWKKILRFGCKGKLRPVAYRLALLVELEKIHIVFHVSMLGRYRSDPSHVISPLEIEIQHDMTYNEELIRILA